MRKRGKLESIAFVVNGLIPVQANSGSSAGWQKVSSFGSDDWAKISDLAAAEYASEGGRVHRLHPSMANKLN